MPRFITVYLQCDWADCDVSAEEGSGLVVPRTVALDKNPTKEFLACKNHSDQLDEILVPLLQKGIKVETGTKKKAPSGGSGGGAAPGAGSPAVGAGNGHPAEEFTCQHDGCQRTLKNRTGMAQHVIRTHGYADLAEYEALYPLTPDNHE